MTINELKFRINKAFQTLTHWNKQCLIKENKTKCQVQSFIEVHILKCSSASTKLTACLAAEQTLSKCECP